MVVFGQMMDSMNLEVFYNLNDSVISEVWWKIIRISPVLQGIVWSVTGCESSNSYWIGNKKRTQDWVFWIREYLLSIILSTPLPQDDKITVLHSDRCETSRSSYPIRYYRSQEDSKMTSKNQVCSPSAQSSWFLVWHFWFW